MSVLPGESFPDADAIEDVVLKSDPTDPLGPAIRPHLGEVQPIAIQNRGGATRELTQGAFFFRLADFRTPIAIVCIGRAGNFNLRIYPEDLQLPY